MSSCFDQIPLLNSNSIERTAFVILEGIFNYAFRLENAPSVFQRAIMKALGNLAHSYDNVYMDDDERSSESLYILDQ